jgi:hypothetical protein
MERKRKAEVVALGRSLTSTVMQNKRVYNKRVVRIHIEEIVGFVQNEFNT